MSTVGKLEPRGRKTERIEAVAELEIGCAIEIAARNLAGLRNKPDAEIPAGYRAEAIRALLTAGADAYGIGSEANNRADEIRHERHED